MTELYLVPDPDEQPKPRLDWAHLRSLGSLPDNVFKLRPPDDEPPEPEPLAA